MLNGGWWMVDVVKTHRATVRRSRGQIFLAKDMLCL
jgi:hypothetical protein